MPIFPEAFDAKIYCNYQPAGYVDGFGWSMIWHLLDQDWPSARATTAKIAEALTWILGDNCWVEWAETVRLKGVPAAQPAITTALTPLGQFSPPNNPGSTIFFRFETPGGDFCNHHFHGLGDGELKDRKWLRDPWTETVGIVPRPSTPATASGDALWAYAMATLRSNTCHQAIAAPTSGGAPRWKLTPWESVIFQRPSFQYVGHKWRRVSWESDDWLYGPAFAVCGVSVSVLHSCYSAPCRFYSGDATRRIRYYWSAPGAAVIDRPTIFWGWAKDKKIETAFSVGEQPGKPHRTYSLGLSWGTAAGLAVDGTIADHLGETPLTPALTAPIDPLLLGACDMPAPVPIRVDNDAATVIDTNATHLTFGAGLILTHVGTNHDHVEAVPATPFTLFVSAVSGGPTVTGATSLWFDDADFILDEPLAHVAQLKLMPKSTSLGMSGDVTSLDTVNFDTITLLPSASFKLFGIKARPAGTRIWIRNEGAFNIWLAESSLSAPIGDAMKFAPASGEIAIGHKQSIELVYSGSEAYWRVVAHPTTIEANGSPAPSLTASYVTRFVSRTASRIGAQVVRGPILFDDPFVVFEDGCIFKSATAQTLVASTILDPGNTSGFGTGAGNHTQPGANDVEYFGMVWMRTGQYIIFENTAATPITFRHENTGAVADKRFTCPDAVDVVVNPGRSVQLFYSGSRWHILLPPGNAFSLAWNEVPSGTIDGVNDTFTLAHAPASGKILAFVNGQLLREGASFDFVLTGSTMVFNAGSIPFTGDSLLVSYQY